MTTTSNTHVARVPVSTAKKTAARTNTSETPESVSAPASSKAEAYARAEEKVRRGKRLVIGGCVVTIVGIVAYCLVSLSANIDKGLGAYFPANVGPLVGLALGVIGLGTLLWLVGSVIYLKGAMDSDPEGTDLGF